jgi:hypothetical protein
MTEDTYTHRPGAVEESRGGRESDDESGVADPETNAPTDATDDASSVADPTAPVERGREEWNWSDWVLVGVIVLCFLVIPATILALPPAEPFRVAYLVLPLIPALLLGAVAVWSAQRSD